MKNIQGIGVIEQKKEAIREVKTIKAIFSGKGLPSRGEQGFTLVELLIVLAILAVLAAVVIPNVTGMFGRGAEQAYETDLKTMQTAVATFFFDPHYGPDPTTPANGWNGTDLVKLHNYPTASGEAPSGITVTSTPTDGAGTYDGWTFYAVEDAGGILDAQTDIIPATIWCGLLVHTPGDAAADPDDPGECAPQDDEKGPYLNEFPKSSSEYNATTASWGNGNPASPGGSYTWVVTANGTVYGVSFIDPTGSNEGWYAGFNGTYP